jgi:hypothetical protein
MYCALELVRRKRTTTGGNSAILRRWSVNYPVGSRWHRRDRLRTRVGVYQLGKGIRKTSRVIAIRREVCRQNRLRW